MKALHNGDWVAIGYSSGWYVRCPLSSIVPGRGDTPAAALDEFERNLKIVEARSEAA